MTGTALRQARINAGMSQVDAAKRLGVSQTLLSLMERDKRNVTSSLARRAVNWLHVTPEELPVGLKTRHDDDQLATDLGTLGYPGYSYRRGEFRNPAEVLLDALDRSDLDARLVEALPWLPLHYPEMNWDWLTSEAKLHNRQNRLGFVVSLSRKVAKQKAKHDVADQLTKVVQSLEDNRLAKTDTLCQESWPPSQRQFVHKNRSRLAAHWNLDTRLTEQSFAQFTA